MSKSIFPPEILNFTIEQQVAKHSTRSQVIYIIIILSILSTLISLPFISVDVSVQSPGIIRPSQAITDIYSVNNGKIDQLFVSNNQPVTKGDTLIKLNNELLDARFLKINSRKEEINLYLRDLTILTNSIKTSAFSKVHTLTTAYYNQEYNKFKEKVTELNTTYIKEKRDFDRSHELFTNQAIAQSEYEDAKFELDQSLAQFNTFYQTQLNTWVNEQKAYLEEQASLDQEVNLLYEEYKNYIITSPVSGTIQGAQSLTVGSIIFSGKPLFSITPDTALLVEVYINPKDIGLLKDNGQVKFQVDAFNYNQWGFATGQITDISKDISIQNEQPVFTVRCSLNEQALILKNGYEGQLIKGMTVNARFIITERTLWQLLFDKIDNWLNPNA